MRRVPRRADVALRGSGGAALSVDVEVQRPPQAPHRVFNAVPPAQLLGPTLRVAGCSVPGEIGPTISGCSGSVQTNPFAPAPSNCGLMFLMVSAGPPAAARKPASIDSVSVGALGSLQPTVIARL